MPRWFILVCILLSAPTAYGSTDETVCDRAANAAAHGSDVPADILRALTRTETGRARGGRLTPWPWTVNMEGAGHWFATRAEALKFVKKHHKRGARSFDVGCFQINYRWHGEAFATIAAMFDPLQNARYAARFLTELRGDRRNWRQAVGRYHSKTPKYAQKYTTRFDRIFAALTPQSDQKTPIAGPVVKPTAPAMKIVTSPKIPPSAEARGMARLAFLAPPSGSALITMVEVSQNEGGHGSQNLSWLQKGAPSGLFATAKPLFN